MTEDPRASDVSHPTPGPATSVALMSQDFTASTVTALRHGLAAAVTGAGLAGDAGYDFVLAVHELVTNAVRHGGGHGHLALRRQDDVLICEVSDGGATLGRLPVRLPAVDVAGGRGLWLASQLAEGLIFARGVHGLTATVTAWLSPDGVPAIARHHDKPDGSVEDDEQ
ncbi:ATP-binding protein [Micromonospora inositola]|uniref:ATP-binding protein n=1 Tax=Micromonospora inositola TaxID=47865 RepID=UPI0012FD7C5F|nr:ATP-binding protein [Micromonospora inositola]